MAQAFSYDVKKNCGVIANRKNDTIELRFISYGGKEPKYDIRLWYTDDNDEERLGKGVTLTREELQTLRDLIDKELEDE